MRTAAPAERVVPLTVIVAFSLYGPNDVNRKVLGATKTPPPLGPLASDPDRRPHVLLDDEEPIRSCDDDLSRQVVGDDDELLWAAPIRVGSRRKARPAIRPSALAATLVDERSAFAVRRPPRVPPSKRRARHHRAGAPTETGAVAWLDPLRTHGRRVRWWNTTAVVIPSSHPTTAADRMIQTSDACADPTAQSSLTLRVFFVLRTTSTARSATKTTAPV